MDDLCKSLIMYYQSLACSIDGHRTKRLKMECSHLTILEGNCYMCQRAIDDHRILPFRFLRPLRLSHQYADQLRGVNTWAALGLRKLHLVLDLDHTLLHAIQVSNLTTVEEQRLKPVVQRNEEGCLAGGGHGDVFLVGSETEIKTDQGFITKLRPFVREFLREAHEMFELTVYTMGSRLHSSRMTKLLDHDGEYFGDRVIAREDCTVAKRKSLDLVLAKESNILILDDTKTVWPDHAENLISIEPYYYFSHGSKKRGVRPRFIHNEDEHDSALVTALRVLKAIHRRYFDLELGLKGGGDVRQLVRQVQSGSLRYDS